MECMDLHLAKDDELNEILWLRGEGRAGQVTLLWGSATGCLTRETEVLGPSMGGEKQIHVHKPWSS